MAEVIALLYQQNYYNIIVLDFVCFVMHFYQLLHTFTVNKHKLLGKGCKLADPTY